MMLSFLLLSLIQLCAVSAKDAPFLQESSFRQLFSDAAPYGGWDVLPFTLSKDSLSKKSTIISVPGKDNGGSCLFAISEGIIYASAEKTPMTAIYTNPFTAWASAGDTKYKDITAMTALASESNANNSTTLFGVTSDNIAKITLTSNDDYPCGKISDVSLLMNSDNVFTWGTVTGIQYAESLDMLFIGSSDKGAFSVNLRSGGDEVHKLSKLDVSGSESTTMLWVDKWNTLFTANHLAFYTLKFCPKKQIIVDEAHEWIGGTLGTCPLDLDYDDVNDVIWIAESESIHKLGQDGLYWRMGYQQGAPMLNTTSVAVHDGIVFSGSIERGLARVNGKQSIDQLDIMADSTSQVSLHHPNSGDGQDGDPWSWMYYYGNRWLPSDDIYAIIPTSQKDRQSVVVVTSVGLAIFNLGEFTLKEKAAWEEAQLKPTYLRHGLACPVNLANPGDLSKYSKGAGDNDGLFTSMSTMGETFRYMTTKEEESRLNAWEMFQGLEKLSLLTGAYPKFTARTFYKLSDTDAGSPPPVDDSCTSDCWYNSPTEGWLYKGDTSSDELAGHFAIYPMLYDHIAQTADEKERVLRLYEGLIEGIVDNDLYFIQPATNERTTWGFWNPKELNHLPEHYSERGANSLEILSWLTTIYSVTGKQKYLDTYNNLVHEHRYIQNCNNVKIDSNVDENHSDTELIMLAYQALFYSYERLPEGHERKEQVWEMIKPMIPSLQKTFILLKGELSPLWLGIYYGTAAQRRYVNEKDISNAVWTLRHWQLDNINWSIDGGKRMDLDISNFTVRSTNDPKNVIMRHIRPPQERESAEWNRDPFMVYGGGNGASSFEPGVFLLPYYIMLYHNMI